MADSRSACLMLVALALPSMTACDQTPSTKVSTLQADREIGRFPDTQKPVRERGKIEATPRKTPIEELPRGTVIDFAQVETGNALQFVVPARSAVHLRWATATDTVQPQRLTLIGTVIEANKAERVLFNWNTGYQAHKDNGYAETVLFEPFGERYRVYAVGQALHQKDAPRYSLRENREGRPMYTILPNEGCIRWDDRGGDPKWVANFSFDDLYAWWRISAPSNSVRSAPTRDVFASTIQKVKSLPNIQTPFSKLCNGLGDSFRYGKR